MKLLILGGGGTLGAFSAGALRALEAEGWRPDAFIASSAGGINLLRWIAGGAAEAEAFWQRLDWKWLLADRLKRPRGRALLDAVSFRARVEADVPWDALLADRRPLGFLVVDLVTGRVSVRGNRTERDIDSLRTVARASYALPPLLPPLRLGPCLLADGGLLRNAPLECALTIGATEIVYLCNVQVAPPAEFSANHVGRASARYLEVYFRRSSNVGFADAPIVEGRYHGVPFLTIAPPRRLDLGDLVGAMIPTMHRMTRLIELGAAAARDALRSSYRVGAPRTSMIDAELGPASVGVRRVDPAHARNPLPTDGSHADGTR